MMMLTNYHNDDMYVGLYHGGYMVIKDVFSIYPSWQLSSLGV